MDKRKTGNYYRLVSVVLLFSLMIFSAGCVRRADGFSEGDTDSLQQAYTVQKEQGGEGIQQSEQGPQQSEQGPQQQGGDSYMQQSEQGSQQQGGDSYMQQSGEGRQLQEGVETLQQVGNVIGNVDCYVYITGAINNPGVYKLRSGDRIFAAVEAAGGLCEDACKDYINQAQPVSDGMMIRIPTVSEMEELKKSGAAEGIGAFQAYESAGITSTGEAGSAAGGYVVPAASGGTIPDGSIADPSRVNINTADLAQLCTLKGIGEAKAKAIIAYRQERGGFKSPEELMEVSGIGQSSYDKIKDDISI